MFRSSTIIRELALNLAKVMFTLKNSVKLRRFLLCGCVAACCHTTVPPHPDYRPATSWVHYTTSCKHSLVLLKMGELTARNMLR